ncbi:hypothetical protein KC678_04615 [Candidatus Dojkabacteria bacterium]|uniref:Uncharacterized protein n=1 Tax=Candidatus Dojkabacteria bacterium TaxID=2099670 RepID=A0A955RGW7_9BACT|nr:hypothetical protein [Candidatus Dojkabacteria bacterium]
MNKIWLFPISFLFIFLSPFVLWNSASQHKASDFKSAKEANIESGQEGYIVIEGNAVANEDALSCPINSEDESDKCIYVMTNTEEYTKTIDEVCSSNKPEDTILENLAPKCDDTGDCVPCYKTEKFEWAHIDTKVEESKFSIGEYKLNSISSANKIGLEQFEKIESANPTELIIDNEDPNVGDIKYSYQYYKNNQDLVIAGDARKNEIYRGDKEFVVSSLGYGETLNNLKSQDSFATNGLRAMSFFLITCGFSLLFTTIAAIPLLITKVIPFVGKDIKNIANTIIGFAGFLIGTIIWILMFIIVSILKSPFLLVLLVIGIAGFGYRVWSKKKEIEEKN